MEYGKSRVRQDMDNITDDSNEVLDILQALTVKATRVKDHPLSLHRYKRTRDWFGRSSSHHVIAITTPITAAPQYHLEITELLSNVAIWLQKA